MAYWIDEVGQISPLSLANLSQPGDINIRPHIHVDLLEETSMYKDNIIMNLREQDRRAGVIAWLIILGLFVTTVGLIVWLP